jgi:hypothetical protein
MELKGEPVLYAVLLKCARNNERYLVSECCRVIEKLDCKAAAPSERRVADYDGRRAALKFQEVLLHYPRVVGQQVVGQGARGQEVQERPCTSAGLQEISFRRVQIYTSPTFEVTYTLACYLGPCVKFIEISRQLFTADREIERGGYK